MRTKTVLTLALILTWLTGAISGLAPHAAAQNQTANEAVVQQFFDDVLSQGNMDLVADLFAPDFVLHSSSDPSQDVSGLDAVTGFATGVRSAFPDIQYNVEDLVSEGDTVVARW